MCSFCSGKSNSFGDFIIVYNLFTKDFLLMKYCSHIFTNINKEEEEEIIRLKFTYCPLCGEFLNTNLLDTQETILNNHRIQLIPQLDSNIKTCFFSLKNENYMMDIFFKESLEFSNINHKISLSINFDPRTGKELLHV